MLEQSQRQNSISGILQPSRMVQENILIGAGLTVAAIALQKRQHAQVRLFLRVQHRRIGTFEAFACQLVLMCILLQHIPCCFNKS